MSVRRNDQCVSICTCFRPTFRIGTRRSMCITSRYSSRSRSPRSWAGIVSGSPSTTSCSTAVPCPTRPRSCVRPRRAPRGFTWAPRSRFCPCTIRWRSLRTTPWWTCYPGGGWSSASASATRPSTSRSTAYRVRRAATVSRRRPRSCSRRGQTSASTTRAGSGGSRTYRSILDQCSSPPHPSGSLGWAGRHGFNIMTVAHPFPSEHYAPGLAAWREGLAKIGLAPGRRHCKLHLRTWVDEDGERAREIAEPALLRYDYISTVGRKARAPFRSSDTYPFADMRATGRNIYGNPDQCIAAINATLRNYQFDIFSTTFNFGGLPHEEVKRSMRLFAKEVMPAFKDLTPPLIADAGTPAPARSGTS